MVAKGLAGAAALALALASAGAFAPGATFVRQPLSPSSYGVERMVNTDGALQNSGQVCMRMQLVFFHRVFNSLFRFVSSIVSLKFVSLGIFFVLSTCNSR